ncbi:MAG TPA: DUF4390 domain-containing protein [Gammaproteobacteria bacterium]|nr:DUF4390 domain-containing protein [Gammaproteobacteria bacterium]
MDLRRHTHLTAAPAKPPGASWVWVSIVATCLGGGAAAQPLVQPPPTVAFDDPGHFEVRNARTELRNGVYLLSAAIDYRLSTEARDALQAGVPLVIRLDVEITHPRRWWFDNDAADLRQSYQLEYHALSERYLVLNVNSSEQTSFGSLSTALESLGTVRRFPLIDAAVLEDERGYDVRMRAVLDEEQFPGPLRLLAFWRRDWSIASDWYRWPLVSE